MKFNTSITSAILLGVSLSSLWGFSAADECPCFSSGDVNTGDDYTEFLNGELTTDGPNNDIYTFTYRLEYSPTRSYSATQRGATSYECAAKFEDEIDPDILLQKEAIISRQQFDSCRGILTTIQPSGPEVEQHWLGETVILQNTATGRFVLANDSGTSISVGVSSPKYDASLHGRWRVTSEDCPTLSNLNLEGRSCFTLYNVDYPTLKLGSNGRIAEGLRPRDNIAASRYILEPLQCSRTKTNCIARLVLSVYGDLVVADSHDDHNPTQLPLNQGEDIVENMTSEWFIEVI